MLIKKSNKWRAYALVSNFIFFLLLFLGDTSAKNYYLDDSIFESELIQHELESITEINQKDFFIISHGRPGALFINNHWMESQEILSWLRSIPEIRNKSLRIYGCNFGEGEDGHQAVAFLVKNLNVEVSASDDITGVDGNWDLEVGTQYSEVVLESFNGNLQTCAGEPRSMLPTGDFDLDGICNDLDYDDDNDGIPDFYEDVSTSSCSGSFISNTGAVCYNPGSGNYVLTQAEMDLISDVNSGTGYSTTSANLPTVNRLNFTTNSSTVTEIRIYNWHTTANVGDLSKPHVASINQIRLVNAQREVVYATTGTIYPTTTATGQTYYSIPLSSPVEGVTRITVAGLTSHATAGFGLRDIFLVGCDYDYDGDGYPNKFDTDSDNDGCPDAVESNAVSATQGYSLTQLDNSWFVNLTVGTNSSANTYGVPGANRNNPVGAYDSTVQSSECDACFPLSSLYADFDNDGVADECDLDADNDGILNVDECPSVGIISQNPLADINLEYSIIIPDANTADYIGPSLFKGGAAYLYDGTCVDVLIEVEQLTLSQSPYFSWDTTYNTAKIFRGNTNSEYEFTVSYFECGTTNPVELSTVYKITDLDGDGDWNNDQILDYPYTTNPTFSSVSDDYVYMERAEYLDYYLTSPTLVVPTNAGPYTYFYSLGNNNYNYSAITGVTPSVNITQAVSVRFKMNDHFKFTYHGGQFGGIAMNFSYDEEIYCDPDGDGQPNYLDSDSDNDGCPDAYEGGGNFSWNDIMNDTLIGGVDADGVPIVVTSTGQSVGFSIDSSKNYCDAETLPDINAGYVGDSLTGNLSTNDITRSGSTYSNPVGYADNPSTDVPVIQADGTYTFTTDVPGVYTFDVEVCSPNGDTPCPTEVLIITILDDDEHTVNPPIANPDFGITAENQTVTVNVSGNDKTGEEFGSLGLPTITNQPSNGTATVDAAGNLVYTPNADFTGTDTIFYEICDTVADPDLCTETFTLIEVIQSGENGISASDDFNSGVQDETLTDNALNNDLDPNGDSLQVTPYTDTIPGVGTFEIDSNGEYTFIPEPDFTGTQNYVYEVCDAQGLCTEATIYLLIEGEPESTMPDINVGYVGDSLTGNISTNDVVDMGTIYSNPTADMNNPNSALPILAADGTYVFTSDLPGVYKFVVEVCNPDGTLPCPTELLTITVLDSTIGAQNPPVANLDLGTTTQGMAVTLDIVDNDKVGNLDGALDNPTIVTQPKNGTAVINSDGELVYTPSPGFIGLDTVYYEVCDTVPVPKMCTETMAIIDVMPNGKNGIIAVDDYNYGKKDAVIIGNAINNDSDPNGDNIMVTPDTVTVAGVGTFEINSSGEYIFTPYPGFQGPVNFPYELCDDKGLCTDATIYMVILSADLSSQPIKVSSFSAIPQGCQIQVQWIVTSTENAKVIGLERKEEGGDYTLIKSYDVAPNSSQIETYLYEDRGVKKGMEYYYRLSLEDLDGSINKTSARRVKSECDSDVPEIMVYPNPSRDIFNLELDNLQDQSISIEIFDMIGRRVFEKSLDIATSKELELINLTGYSSGHYHLNVMSGDGFQKSVKLLLVD